MAQSIENRNNYVLSISIIGLLFFIFGFVTWLNATLIPFLQTACELTSFESYLVTFAFYISYFVMALPSSVVLKKTGFKKGMALGLLMMAIGALIFIPAAKTRTYTWFLFGLFVQGTGLAILQTASNPYVTILGPIESAAKRISIMGVANKFAGILSPIILGSIVLTGIDTIENQLETITDTTMRATLLDDLAVRVILPYVIMAVVLVLLAIAVIYSALPDVEEETVESTVGETERKSIFSFPYFVLGVIALFFYVGVEVIAVDTIIQFGKSLDVSIELAKYYPSFVLLSMIIGYILGIFLIPKLLSQRKALIGSAVLGMVFSISILFVPSNFEVNFLFLDFQNFNVVRMIMPYSIIFVALLGLANALVWPAIWPLTLHSLGRLTKTGSAMLIMAISGGAILPLVWGKLADIYSTQMAYWVMIPCYMFIFMYAYKWYKMRSW